MESVTFVRVRPLTGLDGGDWELEVAVAGVPDVESGMVINLSDLDRMLDEGCENLVLDNPEQFLSACAQKIILKKNQTLMRLVLDNGERRITRIY